MIRKLDSETGAGAEAEISRSAALIHARYLNSRNEHLRPSDDSFLEFPAVKQNQELRKKIMALIEKAKSKKEEFKRRNPSIIDVENKEMSDATEMVMLEMIEKWGSLGDRVHASKTNDIDDFFNHIDAYAEIFDEDDEDEEGIPLVVGFGFDFTTGSHEASRKIQENVKRIQMNRQERPHLDCFVSSKLEFDQHGNEVPVHVGHMEIVPVVIGLESKHAKALNYLYFKLLKASEEKKRLKAGPEFDQKTEEYKQARAQIMSHPVRRMIVEQIALQMGIYRRLLDPNNELDAQYLEKIDQLEDVLARVLPDLKSIEENEDWDKDTIHKRIKEESKKEF